MSKKTRKKTAKKASKARSDAAPRAGAKKAKTSATRKATPKPVSKIANRKPAKRTAAGSKSTAASPRHKPAAKAAAAKSRGTTKPLAPPKSAASVTAPTAARTKTRRLSHLAAEVPVSPSSRLATPGSNSAPTDLGLTVGGKAPAFNLHRDGGDLVSLASYAGRKLVIFFYPRASTPGCTKEAMDFSRLAPQFTAFETDIVGVSADSQRAQESFRDKHDLTIPLLSDETHTTLEAFGVWGEKSLYGRTFHGILRTTVLLGQDGKVIHAWRNVKVDGHADAVLEYVRNL